eukprot:gnl/Dysnectes_brevis/2820_a3440_1513.p1 GENE.gnl/Dysnectes_brevis/2820_a3440_1513~~gnl/Dysnectes_brevis/2820_a3440_1513.p1  ORF type:complete len:600 (+),score=101.41 gnl/Dysnectes_brevis/2820_a3440_1513:51-1850(+)
MNTLAVLLGDSMSEAAGGVTEWDRSFFDTLAINYGELLTLVRENPVIISVLSNHARPSDCLGFSGMLLELTNSVSAQFNLLKELITAEFDYAAKDHTTFMRERSRLPNRITGDFVLAQTRPFLVYILSDFVTDIISKRRMSLEIDPERVRRSDDPVKNSEKLIEYLTQLLDLLFSDSTVAAMPPGLRALLSEIMTQAEARGLGDKATMLAGNLLVLRLIAPALSIPDYYGVSPSDKVVSDRARRNLILLTKLLQLIANESVPDTKEPFLLPFAPLIEASIPRCKEWVKKVARDPKQKNWRLFHMGVDSDPVTNIGRFSLRQLASLHQLVRLFRDPISLVVKQRGLDSTIITRLDAVLLALGRPPFVPPAPYTDPKAPTPKRYQVMKLDRRERELPRCLKLTPSSLLLLADKGKEGIPGPQEVRNEMNGSDILTISAPRRDNTVILHLDVNSQAQKAVGTFVNKRRETRTYVCGSKRQRDELLGELFDLCFSRSLSRQPLVFCGRTSEGRKELWRLTKDSLIHLRGSLVIEELHLSCLEYFRSDDSGTNRRKLWMKFKGEAPRSLELPTKADRTRVVSCIQPLLAEQIEDQELKSDQTKK